VSQDVNFVLAYFQRVLGSDGSKLVLLEETPSKLRVRYLKGDCETCVLEPAELSEMMREMFMERQAAIKEVEVVA
jgi:Fe-S cluster biogenesis protein NfuA